jgi:molybdenum cofactor biosynthesis enzyme
VRSGKNEETGVRVGALWELIIGVLVLFQIIKVLDSRMETGR